MSLALLGADTQAPSLDDVRAGRASIKRGMRGASVEYVQRKAGLTGADVDGVFGGKTEEAVKQFQKGMELSDDGVVGKDTMEALDGAYLVPEVAPTSPKSTAPGTTTKAAAYAAIGGISLLTLAGLGVGAFALVAGILALTHEE